MSHIEQRTFVKLASEAMPQFFSKSSILEIGSLDINGSVRQFYTDCNYIGIDVAAGRGVDVVCQGQDYVAPESSFDQVVSCESMEHNPHWAKTFLNMVRLCRPGGLVLITCATVGRPEHGTARTSVNKSPLTVNLGWSYYRNLTEANLLKAIPFESTFSHYLFATNWSSFDLYFCGIKKGPESGEVRGWDAMHEELTRYLAGQNGRKVCRYRSVAARYLGNWWFILMRWISTRLKSKTLAYMHQ